MAQLFFSTLLFLTQVDGAIGINKKYNDRKIRIKNQTY
jgi:hypothetical protein